MKKRMSKKEFYEALSDSGRLKKSGYLYAIQAYPDGLVKLGFTIEPDKRLSGLQSASPVKLEPVAAWKAHPDDERDLHRRFAAQRVRGEWFEPTQELLEYVSQRDTYWYEWAPPENW